MPALERDSKSFVLFQSLQGKGTTLTAAAEITGWPESAVRQHFHAIAKELGRRLIHEEDDTFRLGPIQKNYDSRRP